MAATSTGARRVLTRRAVLLIVTVSAALASLPAVAAASMTWTAAGALAPGGSPTAGGLACPSATQCTTLAGGGAVTFDPGQPTAARPVDVGLGAGAGAGAQLACPTTSQCTAVATVAGATRVVTFNPTAPGTTAQSAAGPPIAAAAIACPSATLCVIAGAGSGVGQVTSFDPQNPGAAQYVNGPSLGQGYGAISCPSADSCTAVSGAQAIAFDPAHRGPGRPQTVDAGAVMTGVVCQPTGACEAVDDQGNAIAFNPASPSDATRTPVDGQGLTALSCPDAGSCTAVDGAGNAVTFARDDPAGAVTSAVTSGSLSAVACSAQGGCVALGPNATALSFTPGASGQAVPVALVRALAVSSLACSGPRTCVALATAASGQATALSFDPGSPAPAPVGLALGLSGAPTGVACPAADRCVAVDDAGHGLVFDPGAGSRRTIAIPAGAGTQSLACPSAVQCTVVAGSQEETFNPATGRAATPVTIDTTSPLRDVWCPAVTQCTAGDQAGGVVTFDAAAPQAVTTRHATGLGQSVALRCPTVDRCISVAGGQEVAFDPSQPGHPVPVTLSAGGDLAGLACAAGNRCFAVDGAGTAIEFNPAQPSGAVVEALPSASGLGGVTCPAIGACTVVDGAGRLLAGTEAVAPFLSTGSAPTIHGHFRAGGRLTGAAGHWLGTGTISYRYRWLRCTTRCRAIPGATHRIYLVRRADRGKAIRLAVTATNAAGTGHGESDGYGPILGVAAKPSAIRRALGALLPPRGVRLARLFARPITRYPFHAPDIGRVSVTWSLTQAGRRTIVARGQARPESPGDARLKLGLTAAGRRLLRDRARVTVTARIRYLVRDGPTVVVQRRITIRR